MSSARNKEAHSASSDSDICTSSLFNAEELAGRISVAAFGLLAPILEGTFQCSVFLQTRGPPVYGLMCLVEMEFSTKSSAG